MHYFETQVPLTEDAVEVAARLADSGLFADYVVYENGGVWSYAGGARAELTLDRDGALLRHENRDDVFEPWNGDPLHQVAGLLESGVDPRVAGLRVGGVRAVVRGGARRRRAAAAPGGPPGGGAPLRRPRPAARGRHRDAHLAPRRRSRRPPVRGRRDRLLWTSGAPARTPTARP